MNGSHHYLANLSSRSWIRMLNHSRSTSVKCVEDPSPLTGSPSLAWLLSLSAPLLFDREAAPPRGCARASFPDTERAELAELAAACFGGFGMVKLEKQQKKRKPKMSGNCFKPCTHYMSGIDKTMERFLGNRER